MKAEEVSRAHHEDFYVALKSNDLERLSQIYSDDYMLVRTDGTTFSKTQILDDLKTHSMNFNSTELVNEKIRIYGSVGILTGDSKITTVRDGKAAKPSSASSLSIANKTTASSWFIFKVAPSRHRRASSARAGFSRTRSVRRSDTQSSVLRLVIELQRPGARI
jgi:ketosteroid isomerase-like protein